MSIITRYVTAAGIVPYYQEGMEIYFLILCHDKSFHWDFPKGKIENEEHLLQTAKRELHEETGLNATIEDHFLEIASYWIREKEYFIYKDVYFFIGKCAPAPRVVLSKEHVSYKWLSYKEAYEEVTYDTARQVLKKAYAFIKLKENLAENSEKDKKQE